MAKWVLSTPPPFTGTKYGVTVYQLPDAKYYVRMKSSITGERIKKDPVFKGFRKSSGRMKTASPIASFVYQQLRVKSYPLYREMTGKAMLWLKEGISEAIITERLTKEYLQPVKPAVPVKRSLYKIPSIIRFQARKHLTVIHNNPACVVAVNDWNDS
jgi:hypothetical protein